MGNNGLGFTVVDATGNLGADPADLRDVIISNAGGPFAGQASGPDVTYEGAALRAYRAYAGSQSGTTPTIVGGTEREVQAVTDNGAGIAIRRLEGASLGFFGASSASPIPRSIHWAYAASGYPTYLSDVLTGTVSYTLAAATSPTNQLGTTGRLDSATLNVNFTNRTLNAALGITLPAIGQYGVGMVFLPQEPASRMACEQEIERAIAAEGQVLLGWRDVPKSNEGLSECTKEVEPVIRQVFVGRGSREMDQAALERKLYVIRKRSRGWPDQPEWPVRWRCAAADHR